MTTFTYKAPNNLNTLTTNLVRGSTGPLDNSSVFASVDDFEFYISKGKKTGLNLTETFSEYTDASKRNTGYFPPSFKPYVGQIVSVIDINDNNKVKLFQITKLDDENKIWEYQKINPLKDQEFDFDTCTLKEVLIQVIEALGGTVKEEQSTEELEENTEQEEIQQ